MRCSRCQHDNPDDSSFCLSCGARLQPVCRSCGAALPADSRFCNKCGSLVADLLKAYFRIGDQDDHRAIRERVTGKVLTLDRALEPSLSTSIAGAWTFSPVRSSMSDQACRRYPL